VDSLSRKKENKNYHYRKRENSKGIEAKDTEISSYWGTLGKGGEGRLHTRAITKWRINIRKSRRTIRKRRYFIE